MSENTGGILFAKDEAQAPAQSRNPERLILLTAWIFVIAAMGCYGWRIAGIGLDLRQDFWDWTASNHPGWGDLDNALQGGNGVLREAEAIAAADAQKESPLAQPPATIARPGPEIFESPLSAQMVVERWKDLAPVYGQILRGWVAYYEHLQTSVGDGGNYVLDYPPLRLLVMTFWTWHVQTQYFGLDRFPRAPRRIFDPDSQRSVVATTDIAQPLLKLNAFCEAVSALSVLVLVWLWTDRSWAKAIGVPPRPNPWGDRALLIPVIVFGILTLLRPNLTWQMSVPLPAEISPIDARITSVGWWLFLLLRFLSAVCLARFLPRPFRAPMCGLVAATLVWMNPAAILDSFGFPQWDAWMPPFFLLAAVLVTLNWWVAAGLLLGVGCMFKGQLLFVAPVLLLCPLLAGWPGRFLRIVAGLGAGAGMVVWPWLVTNKRAEGFIVLAVSAAGLFCLASSFRRFVRREIADSARSGLQWWHKSAKQWSPLGSGATLWITSLLLAAIFCLLVSIILRKWTPPLTVLLGVSIVTVPWFISRRMIPPWLLFAFTSALWLAGFQLGGSWSWWKIGFLFGTEKHQVMQLGPNSLSNLCSILAERYGWQMHDPVTTLHLPGLGATDFDLRNFLALIYFLALLLCAVPAAIHIRRNDPKFLAALVAPWALFPTLLTQMAARYPVLPAVIGSVLIGVSAELSLLPFLQTILACTMLGNQMLIANQDISPMMSAITQPTHPDIAWAMILLAATFLMSALVPSRPFRREIDVI